MRNLTIKRTKSFVACAVKAKVYMEDPVNEELRINDVPCRKLGELKNGEEKTFQIGNEAARIYVIGDKMSRNYCNDYYPLEAGEDDVVLTGKHHYNPGAGNPFRFEGVADEAVLANRKKGGRKGWVVLVAAIILGFALGKGCTGALLQESSDPMEFTCGDMSIVLTEAFDETDADGFNACYESRDAIVMILEEPFTLMEGLENYTAQEYGELVIQVNGQNSQVLTADGVVWFEYTFEDTGENVTYWYFATVHKSDDAFWLIQFATTQDLAEEYEPLFKQWARSVVFQ